ncbi:hypothetical protein B0A49_02965 [Cryomyces minteri]|uniref:Sm domain-containing protein n=1 Tax=Cryomyces minteri TaxID=331657 RepID=A0A4U0XJM8_9PEZI|nr:hypothetical protein B0A49_02965 [Cryomyces minteri]
MSERASFRGDHRGGDRGGHYSEHHRGGGGDRGGARGGGARGGRGGHDSSAPAERPKKENILDLTKYVDKEIVVKFNGGREVTGVLKGYDGLMNLVLDEVRETLQDEDENTTTRFLGLLVARGTLLVAISPVDGSEEIRNPFLEDDDDDDE